MTSLTEAKATLINSANPDKRLLLADKYIQDINKLGKDFRLPREHVSLKPILEEFAADIDGFLAFVRSVHRALPYGSESRAAVHAVQRTIEVRVTQQKSRALTDAAVAVAIRKGILEDEYDKKLAYGKKLRQLWAKRRKTLLDSHRAIKKRISVDERRIILDEFWEQVRKEIDNGEVPKP